VLDLGAQAPSEFFAPLDAHWPDPTFPLRMWWCHGCRLAQLADDFRVPEEPSGQEPLALTTQRAEAVEILARAGILRAGGAVAEFPSPHGGSFVELCVRHGMRRAGRDEPADVVVDGCFGLMHAPDQRTAIEQRVARLADGGTLVLQFYSFAAMVRGQQWNMLRHGHFAYHSAPVMCEALERLGLRTVLARSFPLYGGTVLLAATAGALVGDLAPGRADEVGSVLDAERAAGVLEADAARGLQASASADADRLRSFLLGERDKGTRVFGYGAASRAVSLFGLADVDEKLVLGVADASVAKQGCRMPGTRVPVISPRELVAQAPDVVLVLVPDLLPEVQKKLPEVVIGGGCWVDVEKVQ
jgi:hypothetical protein